jgi:hypothetical protein
MSFELPDYLPSAVLGASLLHEIAALRVEGFKRERLKYLESSLATHRPKAGPARVAHYWRPN